MEAAVEHVVETFSGDGPFSGFDNPDWETTEPEFRNGGFDVLHFADPERYSGDILRRPIAGEGNFVSRLVLTELEMSEVVDFGPADAFASIQFGHILDNRIGFIASLGDFLTVPENQWIFSISGGGGGMTEFVNRGTDIALEIVFDASRSEFRFSYDNDITDNISPVTLGPLSYRGRRYEELDRVDILISANDTAWIRSLVDEWSITPFSDVVGDFNGNEVLDVADIDLLSGAVRTGDNDVGFDLNGDNQVDQEDRNIWVRDLKGTYFGDANLDGEFASSDLINIFVAGEYEDGIDSNSTWATGDWNSNAEFDSSDLVLAFADGGYEIGPRFQAQSVPEPSSVVLLLPLLSLVCMRRIKHPRKR